MLGRERRELAELLCQVSVTRGKGLRKSGANAQVQPRVPASALCLGGFVMSAESATERPGHLALRLSSACW